jgi:hypothetical protein
MENVGTFYGHLANIMATWHILWPFGNLVVVWLIFPRFGTLNHEKSGNPDVNSKIHAINQLKWVGCHCLDLPKRQQESSFTAKAFFLASVGLATTLNKHRCSDF